MAEGNKKKSRRSIDVRYRLTRQEASRLESGRTEAEAVSVSRRKDNGTKQETEPFQLAWQKSRQEQANAETADSPIQSAHQRRIERPTETISQNLHESLSPVRQRDRSRAAAAGNYGGQAAAEERTAASVSGRYPSFTQAPSSTASGSHAARRLTRPSPADTGSTTTETRQAQAGAERRITGEVSRAPEGTHRRIEGEVAPSIVRSGANIHETPGRPTSARQHTRRILTPQSKAGQSGAMRTAETEQPQTATDTFYRQKTTRRLRLKGRQTSNPVQYGQAAREEARLYQSSIERKRAQASSERLKVEERTSLKAPEDIRKRQLTERYKGLSRDSENSALYGRSSRRFSHLKVRGRGTEAAEAVGPSGASEKAQETRMWNRTRIRWRWIFRRRDTASDALPGMGKSAVSLPGTIGHIRGENTSSLPVIVIVALVSIMGLATGLGTQTMSLIPSAAHYYTDGTAEGDVEALENRTSRLKRKWHQTFMKAKNAFSIGKRKDEPKAVITQAAVDDMNEWQKNYLSDSSVSASYTEEHTVTGTAVSKADGTALTDQDAPPASTLTVTVGAFSKKDLADASISGFCPGGKAVSVTYKYTDKDGNNSYENASGEKVSYSQQQLYRTILGMATVVTDNEYEDPDKYIGYCKDMLKTAVTTLGGAELTRATAVTLTGTAGTSYGYKWTENGYTYQADGLRLVLAYTSKVDCDPEDLKEADSSGSILPGSRFKGWTDDDARDWLDAYIQMDNDSFDDLFQIEMPVMTTYMAGTYGVSGNAAIVYNILTGRGYSSAAALGILGNLAAESGVYIDPTARNSDGYCGIFQTKEERLNAAAAKYGQKWPDISLETQVNILIDFLETDGDWAADSAAYQIYDEAYLAPDIEEFKQIDDIEQAAVLFCVKFERPGNYAEYCPQRIAYAKMYSDQVLCAFNDAPDYVNYALSLAQDPAHGYSMARRDGYRYDPSGCDFDCTSFVYYSLLGSGWPVDDVRGGAYTAFSADSDISATLTALGFDELPYVSSDALMPGDILSSPDHMEIYVGNGYGTVGAHSDIASSGHEGRSPAPGDQGDEVSVYEGWVWPETGYWTLVYRPRSQSYSGAEKK